MKLSTSIGAFCALAFQLGHAAQIPFLAQPEPSSAAQIFKHPSLPAHKLRVTSPPGSVCDDSVRSYSGYLDVDIDKLDRHDSMWGGDVSVQAGDDHVSHPKGTSEHFYFWAFESRNDPKTDPVVLWLNGGPGCSSFTGLLMELGPCKIIDPNIKGHPAVERNPWSWNNNATDIFLDQPVGVGFSYVSWNDKDRKGSPPSRVFSSGAAARDASAFLHLLAMHAGEEIFGGNKDGYPSFHISGESYGGRYLPLIGDQILKDNKQIEQHPEYGIKPLPLSSVLIGNGFTSPKHQFPAYVEYTCTNASGKPDGTPLLDDQTCRRINDSIPTCLALVEKCNRKPLSGDSYDMLACKSAETYCEQTLAGPYDTLNVSSYDWTHPSEYKEDSWVADFLNYPATRKALGIDSNQNVFNGCSDIVFKDFHKTGDGARDSTWAVQNLLKNDIRVLAYSGKLDFICNYVGNRNWVEDLEWSGSKQFRKQSLENWLVGDNKVAGEFKSFNQFSYLTIKGAGHFVPYDQPEAALTMFNRWLHNPANGRF